MEGNVSVKETDFIGRSIYLSWFTRTLNIGFEKKLTIDDLLPLPHEFESEECKRQFQEASTSNYPDLAAVSPRVSSTNDWTHSEKWVTHLASTDQKNKHGVRALIRGIWKCYGSSICKVGVLKVLTTALSFVGPVVLGYIVTYLENGVEEENIGRGLILVALLAGSSVLSAVLNTNYNVRTLAIKVNMQGALIRIVFTRCLSLPIIAKKEMFLGDSQTNNLIQVDVDQVANCIKSIHDLWALPVQIIVACALLYLNIKAAFLAGMFIIVIMIPLNSAIAKKIGQATDSLMKAKDLRIKVVTEALSSITSMKMAGLEGAVLGASTEFRAREVKYLAQRKYLDSACVFLWAMTPVIVPFVTFVTTEYMGVELSASDVITALALLNMLIFPMNALPWVINGLMEARVSLRRLAKVLSSEDGSVLHVNSRFTRKSRLRVTFAASTSSISRTASSDERSRQASNEARRDALLLTVPATVWSWTTSYQMKMLLAEESVPNADIEANTMSPLLAESSASIVGDGDTAVDGPSSTHADAPFAVSVNEIKLRGGELLGVVGSTGSGKTSLLLGVLGEIRGHKRTLYRDSFLGGADAQNTSIGSTQSTTEQQHYSDNALQLIRSVASALPSTRSNLSTSDVAYCPQVPCMHAGSIRANILMGSKMDDARYRAVLAGCCLLQDIETGTWKKGDLTEVGVGGSNLSGGQRLRIGVARAVYAFSCNVILLDDPFAALDATTAAKLSTYLSSVVVGQQHRAVVIATHSIDLLRDATVILLLHHGEERVRGTFAELQSRSTEFQSLLGERLAEQLHRSADPADGTDGTGGPDDSSSLSRHTSLCAEPEEEAESKPDKSSLSEKEESGPALEFSESGYLHRRVYLAYFWAVGGLLSVLIVLTTLLMQGISIGLSFWWAYWATHQEDFSRQDFVLITSALVAVALVAGFLRSVLFALGGLNAARHLYDRLSLAVFHTNIYFFEITPVGQLTNRFGKDSNTIDDSLPFIMNILLAQTFLLLGSCFVMAFNDPPILLLLVVVAYIYHRMQRFYRQSSRELRRLDSVHKSPVYTVFLECMESAPILRGLGEHCVNYFETKLQKNLDASLRVSLSVELASQWLGVRLQLLGALITTILAASIVVNSLYSVFPLNAGMAGLSLIYSFTIINNLNGFLSALSETEQEMVSVERVLEYCDLPSEFDGAVYASAKRTKAPDSSVLRESCGSCVYRHLYCSGKDCCGGSRSRKNSIGDTAYSHLEQSLFDAEAAEQGAEASLSHLGGDLSSSYSSMLVFSSNNSPQKARTHPSMSEPMSRSRGSSVLHRVLSRHHGGLVFDEVCMSYVHHSGVLVGPDANAIDALKNICITIEAGSRVAIVGRTGSGKSSLLRVLLRLNDYHSGTITLGGIELRSISKQRLRGRLSVIPQKPLLFSGTIRFNLDPLGEYSEQDLCDALEMCRIEQTMRVDTQTGLQTLERRSELSVERFTDVTLRTSSGNTPSATAVHANSTQTKTKTLLDFELLDGGANLSVGQQQLLCLARALLRRSDLILVDEATAAVDAHTEGLLYSSLAQYIDATGASMLMVCHKLNAVHRVCNKVLTMDDGRIISYDDI